MDDAVGNLRFETPPKSQGGGPEIEYRYDALNRLTSVSDRGLETTFPEYDLRGNLLKQELPAAGGQKVITRFTYDELGLLTSRKENDSAGTEVTTTFADFDANGNFRSLIDANGQTITYGYDDFGRRTSASYPAGSPTSSIQWDYQDDLRKLKITEFKAAGDEWTEVDISPTWGVPDHVARKQGLLTATVDYGYAPDGQLSSVTSTEGEVTARSHNARNQVESVTVDGEPTQYSYFADGRVDQVSLGNGTVTTHRYHPTRRLHTIATTGTNPLVGFAYQYDANGNRTEQIETRGTESFVTGYEYDDQDRLNRTVFSPPTGTNPVVTQYTFEGMNRTREVVRVVTGAAGGQTLVTASDKTFTYGAGNQLDSVVETGNPSLAVDPYAVNYAYDQNGNTDLKTKENLSTGESQVTDYQFDVRDQLRSLAIQTGIDPPVDLEFDYDHAGLRTRAITPDRGSVDYFYDGSQVIEERDTNSGTQLARYHHGLSTVSVDDATTGMRKYFHQDGLGTTTHLTDASGQVTAEYMLDPWGKPRDQARYQEGFAHGPTAQALGSAGDRNRQLFTGHEYDAESGLYYARARYLDPESGRFMSRDSYLGDGMNPMSLHRYAYAQSNPLLYVDPSGHFGVLKEWTDQMAEAAELARENYRKRDGGWGDVAAGIGAKFAGGIVGLANVASDAALLSGAARIDEMTLDAFGVLERVERSEWGGQARETMYGLDSQIQAVKTAGREGKLVEGARRNILDPLALTVGGTLMGDDGAAFDLMTGGGAFAVDTVATFGAGKVAALTRSSSLGRSLVRSTVTVTSESSGGMVRAVHVPEARPVFVRPDARLADEWAGSVGAARAHAPAPPATTAGRFRGLTSLGDEAGAPMVRAVQAAPDVPRGGAGYTPPSHQLPSRASAGRSKSLDFYMRKVEELDVSSAPNTATFYSGRGQRALAEEFAQVNGRTTLEMTPGGKWLDERKLFGPESPLDPAQAAKVWGRLSERYAEQASGTTIGFINNPRANSIFNSVEYPALVRNPSVTNVITGGK